MCVSAILFLIQCITGQRKLNKYMFEYRLCLIDFICVCVCVSGRDWGEGEREIRILVLFFIIKLRRIKK